MTDNCRVELQVLSITLMHTLSDMLSSRPLWLLRDPLSMRRCQEREPLELLGLLGGVWLHFG